MASHYQLSGRHDFRLPAAGGELGGNELKAYSAVRVKTASKQDTDYGVIWFSARTEVDKVNRMVTLDNFVLNKQSFPTLANNGSAYGNAFILDLPWSKTVPLDLLETSLAVINAAEAPEEISAGQRSAQNHLQHDAGGTGVD